MASANQSKSENMLIGIELDYDQVLLLPLNEGLDVLKAMLKGSYLKGYSNDKEVIPVYKNLKVIFYTEQDIKQMQLEKALTRSVE